MKIINLKKDYEFLKNNLSSFDVDESISLVKKQIDENIKYFGKSFPSTNCYKGKYDKNYHKDWTTGFYTGQLWLLYEIYENKEYENILKYQVGTFEERIIKRINVNHHDMGFLYSLSCVPAWKKWKDKKSKECSILACDNLISRYVEKGNFIKAWDSHEKNKNNRLIIDTFMNLPILFWASNVSKDKKYKNIAKKHLETALKTVIRIDGTSIHTFYFDEKSGAPLYGKARQGYSDKTCWSRGLAWAIYGLPLIMSYDSKINKIKEWESITNNFINLLPSDGVPYWDFCFKEGSLESRDSSAIVIACNGILEMTKHIKNDAKKRKYINIVMSITKILIKKYQNKKIYQGNPLLLHGTNAARFRKSDPARAGYNEGNIYGDYFFLELLVRIKTENKWQPYW